MMAGNPNSWWSIDYNMRPLISSHHQQQQQHPSATLLPSPHPVCPPPHQYLPAAAAAASSPHPFTLGADTQHPPHSWSQLLLCGLGGEEERFSESQYQSKKLEIWDEDQNLNVSPRAAPLPPTTTTVFNDHVKQELDSHQIGHLYTHALDHKEFHVVASSSSSSSSSRPSTAAWSPAAMSVNLSPKSCVTSLSTNILDFSKNKPQEKNNQHPDHSSECNSTATGGICKKARVQTSSAQPPLKVRKEKLGDRITALHQLVSPFGKTDTASVLLEAIGYIRFLQGQIEALSSPYLGNARPQHSLLNDPTGLKRRVGAPNQEMQDEAPKELRSRGLCLVPVSCTYQVGSDHINGADYWSPALGGGF
ncbi:transcription factor bHLH68-like isoform X2 [Malania oleifera]|uniref:transcription factor bHLH68-like isoform X2 n=1 Tax=Malania oleifera TaxID=397392 RepID=UPI0025AE3047|nr:transcription factor bHLH68-like isoform X2 [Malania oleifera]